MHELLDLSNFKHHKQNVININNKNNKDQSHYYIFYRTFHLNHRQYNSLDNYPQQNEEINKTTTKKQQQQQCQLFRRSFTRTTILHACAVRHHKHSVVVATTRVCNGKSSNDDYGQVDSPCLGNGDL